MFAVMVQCYRHFFIPYEPLGETGKERQCIYPQRHAAETVANVFRERNRKANFKLFQQVLVVEAGGK